MNNEINNNNNVNNTGNPSGMNFVQGGAPINNLPPQQPVYQPAGQTPVTPPPVENIPASTIPQPVNPVPAEPTSVNFVSQGVQTPQTNTQAQMPAAGIINQPTMNQNTGMATNPLPVNNQVPPIMQPGPMPNPMQAPAIPGVMPNNANPKPEGEKAKLPIVMIIITVLVVVGVATFLILFLSGKISFGGKSNNNQPKTVEKPKDEVVLADWMNYLLDKDITEIKISRYIDADNTKVVSLNKQQLKKIFTDMKDYSLVKYYSLSKTMPNDDLRITYTLGDAAYTFTLSGEYIEPGDDASLLAFFENNKIIVEDDGTASTDGEDYNYILKGFDSKIYDTYFETINEVDE